MLKNGSTKSWNRNATALVCVPVALNLLLLFQYQVFMKGWRDIAPYPGGAWNLWVERFIVPFRVAARLFS